MRRFVKKIAMRGSAIAPPPPEGRPALARLIERRLFEDGWQVKLIEDADFEARDVLAAGRALHASGTVVVLSVAQHTPDKQDLRDLFTPEAFFDSANFTGSDMEAAAAMVERMTVWRESIAIQGNLAE